MRERSFGLSKRPRPTRLPAPRPASHPIPAGITRQYEPEQIDLNDLAQAVARLLGDGSAADPPHPDLLSGRHRGSHVVGVDDHP
jgi:hypothetical protein